MDRAIYVVLAFVGLLLFVTRSVAVQPQTVESGLSKLEELFGAFNPKDPKQYRMKIEGDVESRPDPTKPPVVIRSNGSVLIGSPFRIGNSLAFDLIEVVKRDIFKKEEGKDLELVRRQQRYLVKRFSLRGSDDGNWAFDAIFVTHSNPRVVGSAYMTGSVNWTEKGIELVGLCTDRMYAPDGSLIPAVVRGEIKFERQGNNIEVSDEWQAYKAAVDRSGLSLPIPDFANAMGEPTKWLNGTMTND